MNELNFVAVKNKRKHHKLLESIMLPYCHELDSNVNRDTPEKTLKGFISSIVAMSEDKDRFVELCYLDKDLIGFAYGKIDSKEHRGYVRPGWGLCNGVLCQTRIQTKGVWQRDIYSP